MAKIITTLAVEDGMDFDEICSFETENYIGIWSHVHNQYMLVDKSSMEFHPYFLDECNSLIELYRMVYSECNEHIEEVYDTSYYTFTLEKE